MGRIQAIPRVNGSQDIDSDGKQLGTSELKQKNEKFCAYSDECRHQGLSSDTIFSPSFSGRGRSL
jgi:hypothetical protein